jgi:hypothetical protein
MSIVLVKSRWIAAPWIEKRPLSQNQTMLNKPVILLRIIAFFLIYCKSGPNVPINSIAAKKIMPYNTHIKKEFHHFIREAADHLFVLSIIYPY